MAGQYPFPVSSTKDQLPFRSCFVDILEGSSLITRAWCPLWKLLHNTGDDEWTLVDKENAFGIHTQTEEHCYCPHLGYLFSHWENERGREAPCKMFWTFWSSLCISTAHRRNFIYQSKLDIWSSCNSSPVWLCQSYFCLCAAYVIYSFFTEIKGETCKPGLFSLFFFFFKWENREANQKPVLPKLQKESAEQRTSPLRCVMIVYTSPFLFFVWGPLLRPWSDTTFLCLSDLKRLKPRLVWYAWYCFFFFFNCITWGFLGDTIWGGIECRSSTWHYRALAPVYQEK